VASIYTGLIQPDILVDNNLKILEDENPAKNEGVGVYLSPWDDSNQR
jgi:hypothetical protein